MRITPLGRVLLLLMAASIAAAILGSGGVQAAGFVVAVLLGLVLAGEGLSGRGTPMAASRKAEVSRSRFQGRGRPQPEADDANQPSSDEIWARERQRRGLDSQRSEVAAREPDR
jgi:hypothetical protein